MKSHNINWSIISEGSLMISFMILTIAIVFSNTVRLITETNIQEQIQIEETLKLLNEATAFLDDYRIIGIVGYDDPENPVTEEITNDDPEIAVQSMPYTADTTETAAVKEIIEEPIEETPIEEVEEVLVDNIQTSSDVPYTEYTIKSGDSLYKIAIEMYGDGSLYPYIEQCNDLYGSNRNLIPGHVLRIYPVGYQISESEVKANSIAKEQSLRSDYLNIPTEVDYSNLTYFGQLNVTGYDPYCSHCCGKSDGITASGEYAEYYKTVACNALPFGTEVYVEGYGYFRVNDTGGSKVGIDIACESHEACAVMTKANVDVYIVK